ncbi:hypothetical protein [Dactylosporangium sp. CS-033363]|uniref:hypothetical protein n=1 Tax=Dactylosporangium sp. CS-033363 TaxID=3239935 RepID=UPI003D89CA7E
MVRRRAVWPAFLLQFASAETVLAAFDVDDPADLEPLLDRYEDPAGWPVFPVPISTGALYLIMPPADGNAYVLDEELKAALLRAEEPQTGPGMPWSFLP